MILPAGNRLRGSEFLRKNCYKTLCSQLIVFWISMRYDGLSESVRETEMEECQYWQWRESSSCESSNSTFIWSTQLWTWTACPKRVVQKSQETISYRRSGPEPIIIVWSLTKVEIDRERVMVYTTTNRGYIT